MKTARILPVLMLLTTTVASGWPGQTPDRVVLGLTSEPETSMAANWRTSMGTALSTGQVAKATAGPDFVADARSIAGESHALSTTGAVARYHSVIFEDLDPNTKYVYRVGDGARWSEWNHFTTASAEPEPFSFIYYGDTQNNVLSMCARVMREAYATCPGASFALHAGDLVNTYHSDLQWGEWFDAAGWINRTVPVLAAAGNHEYGRDGSKGSKQLTSHWNAVFELPRNGPAGMDEHVYYVDYQGTRVVVLNSNEHHAEQADWLKNVLSDNPSRWTIVSMHHPVYSSFSRRNNATVRDNWQPLFDKYSVDLVLQGHDHTYTRSGMMQHDAYLTNGADAVQSESGTVYVVSVAGPKMYSLEQQPFMQRSAERTQLFQVITVDHDQLHFAAYTAKADRYDAFTILKRPNAANQLIEAPDPNNEFVALFNGKNLGGWTKKGGEATYVVEDGCIVGTTKPNTSNTFLCPDRLYGDFELTFNVKCDPKLNSGIQIRSADSKAMVPAALEGKDREKMLSRIGHESLCGPQVEIAANGNAGAVWFEGVGGWELKPNKELTDTVYKPDDWNSYRIVAKGERIKVWINGTKISDGDDTRTKCERGYLGFQVHGVGGRTEPLQVRWRNIRIKELN